ncbi:MAG: PIN domain-containing protein [Syntrophomonadaceae bacterium]|nr:PIN domain-containing protein [Syntrophomonadaceae bacterium]MDD4562888.1 PIN domain-containing protein [Syntrophomonadaceae bacterium]
MGLIDRMMDQRVYLDTNIFIYAVEGYAEYRDVLTELFEKIDQGTIKAISSELTLAEILVKPIMEQNHKAQDIYQQVLQTSNGLEMVPVNRDILIEAAKIRAQSGHKLPDAIHLGTACLHNCNIFLTNDKRIRGIAEVSRVLIEELVKSC